MFVPSPEDMIRLSTLWWRLAAESGAVIAYRTLELSGLRGQAPAELARAMAEKPVAFAESLHAGSLALLSGRRPDQVATAALVPLRARTEANQARLRHLAHRARQRRPL